MTTNGWKEMKYVPFPPDCYLVFLKRSLKQTNKKQLNLYTFCFSFCSSVTLVIRLSSVRKTNLQRVRVIGLLGKGGEGASLLHCWVLHSIISPSHLIYQIQPGGITQPRQWLCSPCQSVPVSGITWQFWQYWEQWNVIFLFAMVRVHLQLKWCIQCCVLDLDHYLRYDIRFGNMCRSVFSSHDSNDYETALCKTGVMTVLNTANMYIIANIANNWCSFPVYF